MSWDGDAYQARFDQLAARGKDMHGEAAFVAALEPSSVLDAGCGTGRVAIELDRRGIAVVGTDVDESMLATAREGAPHLEWIASDLTELDLGRAFAVVVLAGNVPLFTPPGTQPQLVAGCLRHVQAGGLMVTGFQLGRGYELDAFDADCTAAGAELVERFATWDHQPFPPADRPIDYAVSIHRRPV